MHVAICALTFRRPHGLENLLGAIAELEPPDGGTTVEVVVIDNDPDGSGRALVERARTAMPFALRYEVEPRRGIAQARNTAVRVAGAADAIVFVDDDEMPEPRWLVELLRVWRDSGADVVTGPVMPIFEPAPPAWVLRGRFFERPRLQTGQRMTYARTSNVLITGALARRWSPPFDERFSLTGGEDTHFFMRARLAGASIVWADEAIVRESVPTSRVTRSWLVRREYRRGNTLSLCLLDLRDSPGRRLRRAAGAVLRIGAGAGITATAVVRGQVALVRGVQRMAYGAGQLAGLVGWSYDEYRSTHGD